MAASPASDGAPQAGSSQPSSSRDTMASNTTTEPTRLTREVLRKITNNFSEDRAIGQGSYGKVYRGVHDNGEEIAVKVPYNDMQAIGDEQFQHELHNLMMLKHQNIIRLVSYCYETQHQPMEFEGRKIIADVRSKALCFEYMHKGSLQKYIYDECHGLDWHTRYKIIKGTCEGLKYLHEGFKEPLYHLDLKPDNILLDENMVPKLADFGLSKFFSEGKTRVTQSSIGTLGYMPPEYLFQQIVSKKLDIFSLGVVMIKIIAGPRGRSRSAEMPYQEFIDEVHQKWRNRLEATRSSPGPLDAYCEQVNICIEIALSCTEHDRQKRPNIVDIIHKLNETETVIDKALSLSSSSRSWMPGDLVKVQAFTRSRAIQVQCRNEAQLEGSMEAVVSASQGSLGPLLGKLTALLADECGRLKGVRREIRSLRAELTGMHGALKKYTKLEDPDDQVKTWISLVRELAYDTEDCFDNFIHHLGNGGHDGGFKEFCRKTARRLKTLGTRRGIVSQIDDLKLRVKEVKDLKTSYKLDDIACSTSGHASVDPRLSALFAEEAHLVGIDGPRDDLANWVQKEEHRRRVLSIVGFGGLGKTTLANEVYRKVQGDFHCRAFVSVSQKPDTRKIIKDVISQVISQVFCQDEFKKDEFKKDESKKDEFTKEIDVWDEKKSIAKLRELLQDKRYLVIIDDIWSISAWNAISCAFPENNCSSRIIATTRIFEVASSCCPCTDDHIYEMTPLSNLHSERLFFGRIFGSEDCCPNMLKEISNTILKKCGGLPLAIISISSLLANRPRVKEEWEKVKRSIGSDLNKSQSLEGMKNILSLSYSDLPPNLKTCLLYLSNFPEDYVIERKRLVRRWIAEGFISEERGQSCQEVAENYFYELINKSMVQPVDISYDGKVRACRVHDMMLELIISKSIEENFITVVSGRKTVWEKSECFIRRLSIQDIDQELASELAKKDLSHVRSLTVTESGCIKHLPSIVKFRTLRVLDFEGCGGLEEYDMNGIDKLFQLKYFSFQDMMISKIPSGVAMLHDLETLDLSWTTIRELPAGIVQLIKLHHLVVGHPESIGWETEIPIGISNMIKLREISGFNITMSSLGAVEELGSLINLNVLNLRYIRGNDQDKECHKYKRHAEMLLSSLCKLGTYKLQSVRICGGYSSPFELLDSWSPLPSCLQRFCMSAEYRLSKLPKWIAPALTSLAYLNINLSKVTTEDLRILGELPALLFLALWTAKIQKERLHVQGRGFQCLKEFVLKATGTFLFEEGALPKLEKLKLWFCVSAVKSYGFYLGIEHLPCLKDVIVNLHMSGATSSECKTAAVAIRKEANLHPNHPKLTMLTPHGGAYIETDTDDEVNNEQSDTDEES